MSERDGGGRRQPQATARGTEAASLRRERLAAALRENLHRRKDQARQRTARSADAADDDTTSR